VTSLHRPRMACRCHCIPQCEPRFWCCCRSSLALRVNARVSTSIRLLLTEALSRHSCGLSHCQQCRPQLRSLRLDLERVGVNLESVPLDEVIGFRDEHRTDYRSYMRRVRQLVVELSMTPGPDRSRILLDRTEELVDLAADLRESARRAWRKPLAIVAVGAAGAAWTALSGDVVGARLALGGTILGSGPGPCE
jgi:hypothetical protein